MSRPWFSSPRTAAIVIAGLATSVAAMPGLASPTEGTLVRSSASGTAFYQLDGVTTEAQRAAIAATGASAEFPRDGHAIVEATASEALALRADGFDLSQRFDPTMTANARVRAVTNERAAAGEPGTVAKDFPPGDEAYHTYDEVNAELRALEAKYPDIAQVFSIGTSYEGREILGLKISDNVAVDEGEPESLQNCNIHAREHLTTEMCMYQVNMLTAEYGTNDRVTNIVNGQVAWIIPMLNPDGSEFDIAGGQYEAWRKNRQPGRREIGVDLNRNFAYKWGCCNGSSTDEGSSTYRGSGPESGTETKRLADFVRSRREGDKNRLQMYMDWHAYSELVMWPYGYTKRRVAEGMTSDEASVYETLGKKLADLNGYTPVQGSDLYVTDGSTMDFMWGDQGIWAFGMEMYPDGSFGGPGFYPPGKDVPREVERNRETVLTMLEHTECAWNATGHPERCEK